MGLDKGGTVLGFSPITSVFPCQCHSSKFSAPYFVHLPLIDALLPFDSVVN
jgi:hypothetical protein